MQNKLKPKTIVAIGSHNAKTAFVKTIGRIASVGKSPDEAFGELFDQVQRARVYSDGKTFVDMIPRKRVRELKQEYAIARKDPDFNIGEFVNRHFYEFNPRHGEVYTPPEGVSARDHATNLWKELERRNRINRGSLIALPHEYIVPGGRFSEQFYWDTYFIMLGLAADGEWDRIAGMIKNYAHMLGKFGMIPTANRTYFLSRSQPPFFSHMVKLLARHRGRTRTYAEYLPALITEYRFWMKGKTVVGTRPDRPAYARVVAMPNGYVLNRYFDNKTTPRPESLREDIETAELVKNNEKDKIFLDLRAAAESGWDFSSRWFQVPNDLHTIHTTDIVPIDLNCLMYQHEMTLAEAYTLIKQPILAKRFRLAAEQRAETIRRFFWDKKHEFFSDYDFRTGHVTGAMTLAGVFPLYAKIATSEQAAAVAKAIEDRFLCDGGLVTTLAESGQQWDSPNGWAPLQWIAIQGLREYGHYALANKIRRRWLKTVESVFTREQKMIEKYNVITPKKLGGGGEYPLQDGFGWTNGVYAALKDELTQP